MDKNHRLTKKNIYLLQWPTKLDRYSNKQTISVWQNRSIPFLINLPGAWKLLFCLTRIGLLGRIWSFECCCDDDDDDDGGGRKGLFTGVELSEKSLSFTCKKNRIVWKNAFWYLSKTASNCEGQVDESLLNVTKLDDLHHFAFDSGQHFWRQLFDLVDARVHRNVAGVHRSRPPTRQSRRNVFEYRFRVPSPARRLKEVCKQYFKVVVPTLLSGFVCACHHAAPGSCLKHAIYAFYHL